MAAYIESLQNLADQFMKLNGVGRKSSQRMAFSVLDMSGEEAAAFAQAILDAKAKIHLCGVREVIIATNANVEGETTAMFLARLLKKYPVKVTRLAYGISVGTDIEYADEVTLYRALQGRRDV